MIVIVLIESGRRRDKNDGGERADWRAEKCIQSALSLTPAPTHANSENGRFYSIRRRCGLCRQ